MTIRFIDNPIQPDLSLLAIDAAEELERIRKKIPTVGESILELSKILNESFSEKVEEEGRLYRLDYASVISRAFSNSTVSTLKNKTIADLAVEAGKVASLLGSDEIKTKDDVLKKLISFCVALSDSAAFHQEELEELRKHIA